MDESGKTGAIIQIVVVVIILGYGTYQLFLGNFGALMSTMPLLLVYYLFLTYRQKKDPSDKN